jgi:hypothetical protein
MHGIAAAAQALICVSAAAWRRRQDRPTRERIGDVGCLIFPLIFGAARRG